MPEMSEENYQAILTAIEELRTDNADLHKTISDMTAMNKALLSSKRDTQVNKQDNTSRKKELEEKLKRSIR